MIRPPNTPEQMLGGGSSAQVIYRSDAVPPHHQANFRVFDRLDFLAEVSTPILDAPEKTTLFWGWYSHLTRGYRKRHGLLATAEAADRVAGTDNRAHQEVRCS